MTEALKRIDAGIKRGPRNKTGPKPSSPRRNNGQFLPILPNDPESISKALKDYAAGATLDQLATQHNVSKQAIYGWLLGELGGEQHSAIVTQALTSRIARGDEMIEQADNPLDLARGRELSRNYRMDLERRRSSLYGQKQEVNHRVEIPQAPGLLADALSLLALVRDQRQEKVIEPIPDSNAILTDSEH